MIKIIPLNKQSKKAQKEYYKQQRNDWGEVNPISKVIPNKKAYKRKDKHKERFL